MRAAGFAAGFFTAILDILKAATTVWLAGKMAPPIHWVHAVAPILAVTGHNHSIFLMHRDENGRIRFRGGAGGAAALGGAFGLWPPAALIILPVGFLIWYLGGFASLTTLSIGLMAIVIFSTRALMGFAPWVDVFYGFAVEVLMVLALLPNLKRLAADTERRHGLPAQLEKRRLARQQDERKPD
jgi:glycerol-3-phosphate acyltransferase PlsY